MSRIKRDYLVTMVSELLVLLGMVLLFKLAAQRFAVEGFAEFSLVRRVGNLLQLPLAVGVGVALTRYVSIAVNQGQKEATGRLFAAALAVGLVPAGLFVGLVGFRAEQLAAVLFGDAGFAANLRALSILILGLNMHTVVYGYLRGRLAMGWANFLQAGGKALIPLAVFLVPDLTVTRFFTLVGWGQIALATAAAVSIWWRSAAAGHLDLGCRAELASLLRFGVVRVPGEFALTGLLGLPAVFMSHAADTQTAGIFAFSMSLLVMVGGVFSPLGLVMLPQVAGLAAAGRGGEIRRLVGRMLAVALALSSLGAVGFQLIGKWLIGLYLGPEFAPISDLAQLVLWSAIPYVVYLVLRNALEALKVKPYNTKNLLIALVLLVAAQPLVSTAMVQAWVLLGAMSVLGMLTYLDYNAVLREIESKPAGVLDE